MAGADVRRLLGGPKPHEGWAAHQRHHDHEPTSLRPPANPRNLARPDPVPLGDHDSALPVENHPKKRVKSPPNTRSFSPTGTAALASRARRGRQHPQTGDTFRCRHRGPRARSARSTSPRLPVAGGQGSPVPTGLRPGRRCCLTTPTCIEARAGPQVPARAGVGERLQFVSEGAERGTPSPPSGAARRRCWACTPE